SIAISLSGKFIASGSLDNIVLLWDTMTSTQIGPILQHDGCVRSITISPDGSHLVSRGDDRKVCIWSLK
ncbi:hypothetical protein BS17DRAFT_658368, partial [Gyrodon lividus]